SQKSQLSQNIQAVASTNIPYSDPFANIPFSLDYSSYQSLDELNKNLALEKKIASRVAFPFKNLYETLSSSKSDSQLDDNFDIKSKAQCIECNQIGYFLNVLYSKSRNETKATIDLQ
ncbi:MAG: hypothetical protein MHPSP_003105, partial [Paramarteilia canceri]